MANIGSVDGPNYSPQCVACALAGLTDCITVQDLVGMALMPRDRALDMLEAEKEVLGFIITLVAIVCPSVKGQ